MEPLKGPQVYYLPASQTFAGKAGACPSGTPFMTQVQVLVPSLACKYYARVKVTENNKHTSLPRYRKKFIAKAHKDANLLLLVKNHFYD